MKVLHCDNDLFMKGHTPSEGQVSLEHSGKDRKYSGRRTETRKTILDVAETFQCSRNCYFTEFLPVPEAL